MTKESHIAELRRRHDVLDRQLRDAVNHPSTDDIVIHDIKRRKLMLKDEMTKLTEGAA